MTSRARTIGHLLVTIIAQRGGELRFAGAVPKPTT